MKIKVKKKTYEQVMAMKPEKNLKPMKPMFIFRLILKIASAFGMIGSGYKCNKIGMEKLDKNQPALYLMNHSAFIDLMMASYSIFPRPVNIVTTTDAFVGMNLLMRLIGCIPAKKFIADTRMVRDMLHAVKKNNTSILMYPEASYSFDGTATPLPESIGKFVKLLGIPVVMIRTYGAFLRDPLYNGLQIRKNVKVSADFKYLISPEEISNLSETEINEIIGKEFTFDNFKWQQETGLKITAPFRADGLNRVLYKCPHCMTEGEMVGNGTTVTCNHCKKIWELTEEGYMKALEGETEFSHIPDWYKWERECVKQELIDGKYSLDIPVKILMGVNSKSIYEVGEGRLTHSADGFHLIGCDGKLDFSVKPSSSYSLYSDYLWYEIGDMICIGDTKAFYYCFPQVDGDFVAKTRLATEELYKLTKQSKIKA